MDRPGAVPALTDPVRRVRKSRNAGEREASRRRGTVQPETPGATSVLNDSSAVWMSPRLGAKPCVGPIVGPKGEVSPTGCFDSKAARVSSVMSAILDSPPNTLAAEDSLPDSTIRLTTFSFPPNPTPIASSGQLTWGYCSSLSSDPPCLTAGTKPTLTSARISSNALSEGSAE